MAERAGAQDKMLHLDIRVDDLDLAVEHTLAAGRAWPSTNLGTGSACSWIPPATRSASSSTDRRHVVRAPVVTSRQTGASRSQSRIPPRIPAELSTMVTRWPRSALSFLALPPPM